MGVVESICGEPSWILLWPLIIDAFQLDYRQISRVSKQII